MVLRTAVLPGDRLRSVCPSAWQGCLQQQQPSSPSEGDLGKGQLQLGHPFCMRSKFLGATERGKRFNLDAFLKEKMTPG